MVTSQSDTCIRDSDLHADVTVMSNYYDLCIGSCNDISFLKEDSKIDFVLYNVILTFRGKG